MSGSRPRALVVVGTRPEAIKMAPVVQALEARSNEIEPRLVLTGQHDELVHGVLDAFGLAPAHDLEIMSPGQTLYDVAHRCLDGLREVVAREKPSAILVQGDTATVCFGALVGFLEGVRVGHVEAGLRSHDKWAPWPEEIFRRLTDVLSDWYFAPTEGAAANLRREGVPGGAIHLTGNTVVDALQQIAGGERPVGNAALRAAIDDAGRFILLTAHRRESFGEPIREVFRAVRTLADRHPDVRIVYPVHPNPEVQRPARELLSNHPRIALTDPVDYFDLVAALREADLVLTDSGGIQEEAPTFGTPVLVLREVTERPEGVEAGVAALVGTSHDRIVEAAETALASPRGDAPSGPNPYGDGHAARRIADIVIHDLTGAPRTTRDRDAAE
ncbi:MAG: UDP-N-acetylglucosamine 2-epimerase (non-hydrolyzing) [Longimicrobiales bacterium]|nr:UDP-N-acetylglucosamine 2-epimerase (non-hydrolyzing) [Longimicrobiales bacterium]